MGATAKTHIGRSWWAASCVSKLVVELETGGFAAAHSAVIDKSAAPFVALPHHTAHRTGYIPAAPARGIGASVVAGLGRQLGSLIALVLESVIALKRFARVARGLAAFRRT